MTNFFNTDLALSGFGLVGERKNHLEALMEGKKPSSMPETIGMLLKALRESGNIHIKQLSEQSKVSERLLTKLEEKGEGRMDNLFAVCSVMKISPFALTQAAETFYLGTRAALNKDNQKAL